MISEDAAAANIIYNMFVLLLSGNMCFLLHYTISCSYSLLFRVLFLPVLFSRNTKLNLHVLCVTEVMTNASPVLDYIIIDQCVEHGE